MFAYYFKAGKLGRARCVRAAAYKKYKIFKNHRRPDLGYMVVQGLFRRTKSPNSIVIALYGGNAQIIRQ
jgi:hypothetical protein